MGSKLVQGVSRFFLSSFFSSSHACSLVPGKTYTPVHQYGGQTPLDDGHAHAPVTHLFRTVFVEPPRKEHNSGKKVPSCKIAKRD